MATLSTATQAPRTGSSHAALIGYFIGAFGITWLFWGGVSLSMNGQITLPVPDFLLMVLGGLGPMLAAIFAAAAESDGAGVRALFRQLGRARVRLAWYAAALVLLPLLRLAPVPLHLLLGGVWPAEDVLAALMTVPFHFVFVALVGGGLDEEMGWRGYALPRLQERLTPMQANLLLGIVWSFWHLPLWFIPGSEQAAMAFPLYLISTTALSFVLGWIYNSTGGSLLLAILAHTGSNVADNIRATVLRTNSDPLLDLILQGVLTATMVSAAIVVVMQTRGTLGAPQADMREAAWNTH
jgi:membrane protease YdiL (CAAX protease family)